MPLFGLKRTRVFAAFVSALLVMPLMSGVASARPAPTDPDGGTPTSKRLPANDLAAMSSDRWIVQLSDPPAAVQSKSAGRFNPSATGNQAYALRLMATQRNFEA